MSNTKSAKWRFVVSLLLTFLLGAVFGFWVQQLRESNYIPLGPLDNYERQLAQCGTKAINLNVVADIEGADSAISHFRALVRNCLRVLSLQKRYFNEAERASFDRLVNWAERNHPGLYCDASSGRCSPE